MVQNISFKSSHQKTEQGNTYYNSNMGKKVAGVTLLGEAVLFGTMGKKLYKDIKIDKEAQKASKRFVPFTLCFMAITALSGLLTDKLRNNKQKKLADGLANKSLPENCNIEKSKNGKYFDSDCTSVKVSIGLWTLAMLGTLVAYVIKHKKRPDLFDDGDSVALVTVIPAIPSVITDLLALDELNKKA